MAGIQKILREKSVRSTGAIVCTTLALLYSPVLRAGSDGTSAGYGFGFHNGTEQTSNAPATSTAPMTSGSGAGAADANPAPTLGSKDSEAFMDEAMKSSDARAAVKFAKEDVSDERRAGADDTNCKVSATIDGSYACDKTQTLIQTTALANTAAQTLGAQAVNTYGAISVSNATSQGTVSAPYKAAAQVSKVQAGQSLLTAIGNFTAGYFEYTAGRDHSAQAKQMKASASTAGGNLTLVKDRGDSQSDGRTDGRAASIDTSDEGLSASGQDGVTAEDQARIIKAIVSKGVNSDGKTLAAGEGGLNARWTVPPVSPASEAAMRAEGIDPATVDFSKPNPAIAAKAQTNPQLKVAYQEYVNREAVKKEKEAKARGATSDTANAAAREQENMAATAKMAALQSLVLGVQNAGQAALGFASANQMSALADKLNNTNSNGFVLTSGTVNPGSGAGSAGSTAINPGSSTDTVVALDNAPAPNGNIGDMTPPVNPDGQPMGSDAGPIAGAFESEAPKGAGGAGAGGPAVSVAGTSPAKDENAPQGPRSATESRAGAAYSIGGGSYVSGGVGAEKGADLSFLANLLPKPEDKSAQPQNILDFGSRSPASLQPYSFLGRDANLFKRISETMATKNKHGLVGG